MEMESDVDTGEEGFIECFDTIGGEEEDPAVVLDVTETEYGKGSGINYDGVSSVFNLQDGHHSISF